MLDLPKAGASVGPTNLGANESSRVWECEGNWFTIHFREGGANGFHASDLALLSSPIRDGVYNPHTVDESGTPTAQVFTDGDENLTHVFIAPGMFFKLTMENANSPDVDVYLGGKVKIH
jgi:hypothetical protein